MQMPWTQHLLPDGRTKPITMLVSNEHDEKIQTLLDAGYTFHAEMLRTGAISLTCENPCDDPEDVEDIAIELVSNGPGMKEAALRVLGTAWAHYEEEKTKCESPD